MTKIETTFGAASPGVTGYRHVDTNSGFESWYWAGAGNATALTTVVAAANVLIAIPWICSGRGGVLDRMGINVTGLSAGAMRPGIYQNTGPTNLYPAALLLDAGPLDTSAVAVVNTPINFAVNPGDLLWFVTLFQATPTVNAWSIGANELYLGVPVTLPGAQSIGLSVAQAFGPLPPVFPAGAVLTSVSQPAVAVRFGA